MDILWFKRKKSHLCARNELLRETVCITYFPMELDSAQQLSSVASHNAFACLHHHHLPSLHFLLMKLLHIDITLNCLSTVASQIKNALQRCWSVLLLPSCLWCNRSENLQNLKTTLCRTHSRNYKTQRSICVDTVLSSLKLLGDFSSVLYFPTLVPPKIT